MHGARRVRHPVAARPRIPLDFRSLHRHAARRHRGVLSRCRSRLAGPAVGLRGHPRVFAPTTEIVTNPDMLYLAIGIIGATVMPHNLYLHSGVVQTRRFGDSVADKREAIKLATLGFLDRADVRAADQRCDPDPRRRRLQRQGRQDRRGRTAIRPTAFLAPLLGSVLAAPTLFGIALLCCGLNSTVTATLAGQIVMEGFIDIRLAAWLRRRLITRSDRHRCRPRSCATVWYGRR